MCHFTPLMEFTTERLGGKHSVPRFVAEAEYDWRHGGGTDLDNASQCPKEYVLFKTGDGGREVFFKRCLLGSIRS